MFPKELQQALEKLADSYSLSVLSKARKILTHKYRSGSALVATNEERISYLLSRMPATYAAIEYCLKILKDAFPLESYQTVLDIGAGPGTVSWAVVETFESIGHIVQLEKDKEFMTIGKKLFSESSRKIQCTWVHTDMTTLPDIDEHDLVICSYSLGEIGLEKREIVLEWLWKHARKALLIIEPGSMKGFQTIKEARNQLIANNAHLVAPCPHAFSCPMLDKDWCHFSVRLERSIKHRLVKQSTLSYEDEKFSYILFSRSTLASASLGRIVHTPSKHSGHITLDVCTDKGELEKILISRREKERYKKARKLEWGDQSI